MPKRKQNPSTSPPLGSSIWQPQFIPPDRSSSVLFSFLTEHRAVRLDSRLNDERPPISGNIGLPNHRLQLDDSVLVKRRITAIPQKAKGVSRLRRCTEGSTAASRPYRPSGHPHSHRPRPVADRREDGSAMQEHEHRQYAGGARRPAAKALALAYCLASLRTRQSVTDRLVPLLTGHTLSGRDASAL